MVKIIVCGAMGRMGSNIVDIIKSEPESELSGAVEVKGHKRLGEIVTGKVNLVDSLEEVIDNGDVVIDFTNQQATLENLEIAKKARKAFVVGATGFSGDEIKQINRIAVNIPCVKAPNWGVGMNLLFKLVREIAGVFEGYDVEIIEAHHNKKKDAPSGTAYKLAENIAEVKGMEKIIFGRKGKKAERNREEIGIHAVRGGSIIGDHTIIFAGDVERMEITHRAQSRECFSNGAVRAAKWVISQPAGMYDMSDVLGLK